MSDRAQIIRNLIGENEGIKEQLKRAGEAIADWQRTLESEMSHKQGSPMKGLSDKQWQLVQAMGFLQDGLFNHYQREQKEIAPFVGLLGEALGLEGDEIREQLQRIRLLLTDDNLKDWSGTELATKYSDVKRELDITYRLIYDHTLIEDHILRLLLKATTHTDVKKERK
jgi:DUF438 domain-containing protein